MDRLRRRAFGRRAEVTDSAYLAADIARRTVGIPGIAMREAEALDPLTGAMIDAFVAGINRGIAVRDLPPEFDILGCKPEPFTRACVVGIARGLWWSLNGRIDRRGGRALCAAGMAPGLPDARRFGEPYPSVSGLYPRAGGGIARRGHR